MNRTTIVCCIMVMLGIAPWFGAYADSVSGNGYTLDQSVSVSAYNVSGNGYSATVVSTPIYGEQVGNGFSSRATTDSAQFQNAVTRAEQPASTSVQSSGGGSSGGSMPMMTYTSSASSVPEPDNALYQEIEDSTQITESLSKYREITKKVESLWSGLGGVVYATGGAADIELSPDTSSILVKTFDSKTTFGLFSVVVAVMLFFALSVSVFGYNEIPKITSVLVGIASILGFLIVSDIYILPAALACICLFILLARQSQREIMPSQSAQDGV